jgi:hypothetical protein
MPLEHRAVCVLTAEMTANPRNMLQKLVETAVDLCQAENAGISIRSSAHKSWRGRSAATMPTCYGPAFRKPTFCRPILCTPSRSWDRRLVTYRAWSMT